VDECKPLAGGVDKAYYTYDFELQGARILLTCAIEQGNAFLLVWTHAKSSMHRRVIHPPC